MKLAHFTDFGSMPSFTTRPLASSERMRKLALPPGFNSASLGIICNCVALPAAGHFSAGASANQLLPKVYGMTSGGTRPST